MRVRRRQILPNLPLTRVLQPSKKIVEESDSDSFDKVDENQVSSNSKLGDIVPTIRRMVFRGQGKNYDGVGKKPTTVAEAKARGKSNTKIPQPGDVGE